MPEEARVSYMSKDQLENYLADLRTNRPQRPSGARPLSSSARSRWSVHSTSSLPLTADTSADPIRPSLLHKAATSPTPGIPQDPSKILNRRSSKLLRKSSHRRAQTASPATFVEPPVETDTAQGWDGVSLQDGRMGDVETPKPTPKKKESTGSFRDFSSTSRFAQGAHGRSQSVSSGSTASSSSSLNNIIKKTVSWDLTARSRPASPAQAVMPPCYPLPKSARTQIIEELSEHFRSSPIPAVAPLRINKSLSSGRSIPSRTLSTESSKLPVVQERERESTYSNEKEYGTAYPPRREYVDPHKKEPTQHHKLRYTVNPEPLPSPPMSGSEEEDAEAEAEALKELGRRPLPKVGNRQPAPPPPLKPRQGGNKKKYGARIEPQPPVIGIVSAPSPPPSSSATRINPLNYGNKASSSIPTICTPDDDEKPRVPTINLPGDDDDKRTSIPALNIPAGNKRFSVPTINLPGDEPASEPNRRPLPIPGFRRNSKTSSSTYSSSSKTSTYSAGGTRRGPTVTCTHCNTHIEGRIVSAASLRFHPECFRCDHCHTRLEHVGFFPEPDEQRRKRVEKAGPHDDPNSGGRVRFYCHLDFHELFSPRCKSCKTPIEGEVVVACGSTWHAGHFFCAECGDPFNAESRFVEKDGYAWCVGCYTSRYSGRCKKCKKPVTTTVVKALGGEWHEECFCCTECNTQFDDGRFFVRNKDGTEVPVCVRCEERRLKA